jgi:hypothetical protein
MSFKTPRILDKASSLCVVLVSTLQRSAVTDRRYSTASITWDLASNAQPNE